MNVNDVLILYVKIVEEDFSPHIGSKENLLSKRLFQLISADSSIVSISLEDIKNSSFSNQNMLTNLLIIHHYIETKLGKKIKHFKSLNTNEIIMIQNSLGDAWLPQENKLNSNNTIIPEK